MDIKTLPLDPVVKIIVNLAARAAVRKSFDLALLVGKTEAISPVERLKIYSSIDEMLSDGFTLNDRLYKAAALIFGQSKAPSRIAIGCLGNDETPLESIIQCRNINSEWYVCIFCDEADKQEHLDIAEYINSCTPDSLYAYTTSEAEVLTNAAGNIFAAMKAKNYRRVIGQYSTQHPNAIAAIIGYAMGAMSGTNNSAFTLAYKSEIGVETENASNSFSSNAVETIKANNGNVFINRGSYYDVFEEGVMANGTWFDEMIYLDKYKNDMQLGIMDLLYQNSKLPQTEGGMTRIHNAIKEVCETALNSGFIAPGVWKSANILDLKYGAALPKGYLIQSESIDFQIQADREARKAPNIYVALKLAGAIHHVVVQLDINR